MRPSAPGNRDTPSLSIERHTSRRTSSFARTWGSLQSAPMADGERTSIGTQGREGAEIGSDNGAGLPPVRDQELRDYLPGVEPERQLNDWGRSERVEGFL